VAVILNEKDLKTLEEVVLSGVKDKLLKGVILKANDNFNGGFRIAVNNGSAYYDYSAEAVVDMLSNYLSPKVTALLKEAE
jgi:V/A-type H+-transporting ATPase subunit E